MFKLRTSGKFSPFDYCVPIFHIGLDEISASNKRQLEFSIISSVILFICRESKFWLPKLKWTICSKWLGLIHFYLFSSITATKDEIMLTLNGFLPSFWQPSVFGWRQFWWRILTYSIESIEATFNRRQNEPINLIYCDQRWSDKLSIHHVKIVRDAYPSSID